LVPLTAGDSVLREALFSEVSYHAAYEPMRSIRTSKWKYIRRFDRRTTPVLPNCDDGPARRALLAEGWGERDENVSEQLYDLIFDPAESNNLAHDYQFAVVRDDLRAQLAQWMERTHDPLLIGPVPAPAGSQVNDPAGRDANGPILTIVPAGFANSGAGTQIL